MKEDLMQRKRKYLLMPKKELTERCLLIEEEIERLTELCNKYEEEHKTTFETWQKDIKENELLHSIIKEVREYIETHLDNTFKTEFDYITTNPQELLEILSKAGNE